ncbi:non-homologous end joining protein Ku [Aquicella lusitana]|uniref:Non-homologous end joining protein Ku n=1 Tax=Aquicella lusitana TaxID=254246 RepID=A0A370GJ41_9COXI|nr:Ku protein [Aquicella lusitana]RDI43380.1 DNA end-binding protein Ku [Aquicella lusitana]VVC73530.1 hypothetical protein AQULUS_12730 [Aquicella lusitana]
MPNAIWKGHISFGLVSVPIVLYSSEDKSASISFRQIDKRNNARIKHVRINAETGEEVPWEDVVKGYEYDKDKIIVLDNEELEKLAGENAQTIAIESFVDRKNLEFVMIDKTYYLVPDKNGEKGYVILREALLDTDKIGIAKVIISTKEYLAAVAVYKNALVIYTLKYDDEIRKLSEFPIPSAETKKYKISKKEMDIAKQLVQSMASKWKPEEYKDEYKEAVDKLIERKMRKLPVKAMKKRGEATATATNVIDFVSLLKKSLASKKAAKNDKKYKTQRKRKA